MKDTEKGIENILKEMVYKNTRIKNFLIEDIDSKIDLFISDEIIFSKENKNPKEKIKNLSLLFSIIVKILDDNAPYWDYIDEIYPDTSKRIKLFYISLNYVMYRRQKLKKHNLPNLFDEKSSIITFEPEILDAIIIP